MIEKFLSMSDERKARLLIWLYDRYVTKMALDELHDIAIAMAAQEVLQDEGLEVLLELETPSVH